MGRIGLVSEQRWLTGDGDRQYDADAFSALAPLMIWYAFARHGHEEFGRMVAGMLDVAEYAVGQFNERGIPAWRHRNSVTVVFPRPWEEVFRKWQMAPEGEIAHIITMPHVTREMIDELVDDCAG